MDTKVEHANEENDKIRLTDSMTQGEMQQLFS
jgi:hypothetical protein